jgi:hypothetical protein
LLDIRGGSKGHQIALIEDGEAITDAPRSMYIVGYDNYRSFAIGLLPEKKLIDFCGSDAIQSATRLIREQHLWLKHERTRQPRPFPHSTRKVGRHLLFIRCQTDLPQNSINDRVDFILCFIG